MRTCTASLLVFVAACTSPLDSEVDRPVAEQAPEGHVPSSAASPAVQATDRDLALAGSAIPTAEADIAAIGHWLENLVPSTQRGSGVAYFAEQSSPDEMSFNNGRHGLRVTLSNRAIAVSDLRGTWDWSLGAATIWCGDEQRQRPDVTPEARDNLVLFQQGEVHEWYVNSPAGMEQGFTIQRRLCDSAHDLRIEMGLGLGDELEPVLVADGSAFVLRRFNGTVLLRYDSLFAFDATGRELPSHMSIDGGRLALHVDGREAEYPIVIDPMLGTGYTYIKASNPDPMDVFGHSLAISGQTMVVGAWREQSEAAWMNGDQSDNSADMAGAAYVFEYDEVGGWVQTHYLKSGNPNADDQFSRWAIDIDQDLIVIGSPHDQSNSTEGAAYVYERDALNNTWLTRVRLEPWDTNEYYSFGNFGQSVAVSEDTIVVGAGIWEPRIGGRIRGGAYVYRRDPETNLWSEEAFLTVERASGFGIDLDIHGDTIVVTAQEKVIQVDGELIYRVGAAYVFEREGSNWALTAELMASNRDQGDEFGSAVAVGQDYIVLGAPWEDGDGSSPEDNSEESAGAAYVFARTPAGDGWQEIAYLKSEGGDKHDNFGRSVAVDEDTIIVGALGEQPNGAVYLFERNDEGAFEQERIGSPNGLDPPPFHSLSFGQSVAMSGGVLVVGDDSDSSAHAGVGADPNSFDAMSSGAVYVFGTPSVGECADGTVDSAEACDDGNLNSGDGCSITCQIEHRIDFEADELGHPIAAGEILEAQWRDLGITISCDNPVASRPDLCVAFDSSDPLGTAGTDADLGTPNADFGGAGSGAGGAAGQPGENAVPLGNVMIVAENDRDSDGDELIDSPDDNNAGGSMTFVFDPPRTVLSGRFVDIDTNEAGGSAAVARGGLADAHSIPIPNLGDNSVQVVDVNLSNVTELTVELVSSGALADIVFY